MGAPEDRSFEGVVGLEVHAQLLTVSKAFCACSTAFGAPPNTQVCPVCLGLPGALPVLNGGAVGLAVRAALALDCEIQRESRFSRKNYFYPDLPKGYQISQYDRPFSLRGHLDVEIAGASGPKRARITRVHMEEDAGKNLHGVGGDSIVDLNRAGVPLIEIVGEPDLSNGAEAAAYLRALRDILVFVGVNDGNLEEGSFRCDANVSVRPAGETKLGTRVELKNINSFRFVEKAIDHEIERQKELVRRGERIVQETRGWDEKSGTTYSLRSKEEAQDYRYFDDADLPPLVLSDAFVEGARAALPEFPKAKRDRYASAFGLTPYAALVLTQHPQVASFFESVVAATGEPVPAANFIQAELLRDVETHGIAARIPITPGQIAGVLLLVKSGRISSKQAKDVYAELVQRSRQGEAAASAEDVVASLGIVQVTDAAAIEAACRAVVRGNPKQAAAYRAGKTALLGFFVGQVMKETGGSANPGQVNEALKAILGES